MAWWNNIGAKILDFFVPERKLPERRKAQRAKARKTQTPRTLPGKKSPVSRETPLVPQEKQESFNETLTKFRSENERKNALKDIFMDSKQKTVDRKAALVAWAEIEGYWRPENNNEWSSEEWKRWEEIYESEPEVF